MSSKEKFQLVLARGGAAKKKNERHTFILGVFIEDFSSFNPNHDRNLTLTLTLTMTLTLAWTTVWHWVETLLHFPNPNPNPKRNRQVEETNISWKTQQ